MTLDLAAISKEHGKHSIQHPICLLCNGFWKQLADEVERLREGYEIDVSSRPITDADLRHIYETLRDYSTSLADKLIEFEEWAYKSVGHTQAEVERLRERSKAVEQWVSYFDTKGIDIRDETQRPNPTGRRWGIWWDEPKSSLVAENGSLRAENKELRFRLDAELAGLNE